MNNTPITPVNATYRLMCIMKELTELMGNFPEEVKKIDPRAWADLQAYAPKPERQRVVLCVEYDTVASVHAPSRSHEQLDVVVVDLDQYDEASRRHIREGATTGLLEMGFRKV